MHGFGGQFGEAAQDDNADPWGFRVGDYTERGNCIYLT